MDMAHECKYVVDIMTSGPVLIGPEANAASADHLAMTRGVHHLLVMDGYRLIGVVCPCDLYAAGTGAHVSDCMHQKPFTIDDQQTAEKAWEIMQQSGVGCLPVVDWTGSLRGVITRRDLRRAGILAAEDVPMCSSCGSTHGLRSLSDEDDVFFCVRCIDQHRQPRTDFDEQFFTIGGGD